MKKRLLILLSLISIVPFIQSYAQDIEVIRGDSVVYGSPGDELVINIKIVNISLVNQVVFLVRSEETIPADWTSSLCFGILCFPPNVDSVATDAGFFQDPVPPGDTLDASVHFFTSTASQETGHVQIQIGSAHNPDLRTVMNLIGSTEPSAVIGENKYINDFKIFQNYPNPFNPSTKISFVIPQRSNVSVKVYNITGTEIATLVNEVKDPGSYSVTFNAAKLSSGVYFYKITAGKFSSVRKMILIK
jgi:hypothetical protein